MNFLQRLLGKAQPAGSFTPAPMKKVNVAAGGLEQLMSGPQQTQGNDARLNAQAKLGFTPAFAENIANAAPYVGYTRPTGALNSTRQAAAEYLGNSQPNQIVLGRSSYGQSPSVVLHEGLHRAYATNPQVHSQFNTAYDQGNNQPLRQYLANKLSAYSNFTGDVPLNRIENLPPNLQDEAHSMIGEYYGAHPGNTPQTLANYYKQFLMPKRGL